MARILLLLVVLVGCKDRTAHVPPASFGIHEVVETGGVEMQPWDSIDTPRRVNPTAEIDGSGVAEIWEEIDDMTGLPHIRMRFTPAAATRFANFTQAQLRKPIAIVVDGRILSAPIVQDRIGGGEASLTVGDPANLPPIRAALHLPPP